MGPAPRASGRALGRLRALGRGGCEPAGHLLDLVGLDHVARLHVLVALERHAALVATRHLARVLFEALEARDPAVVHDHVVTQAPRRILPSVTKQPATWPMPETVKACRTSARPSTFSWSVGSRSPSSASRTS